MATTKPFARQPSQPKRSGMSRQRRNEALWGVLCVAPAILGFLIWQLGPIIASLLIAFTDWNIAEYARIGSALENFQRMFYPRPALFWKSLRVTAVYTLGSVPLSIIFAFFLAVLLNQKIRGLAYLPHHLLPTGDCPGDCQQHPLALAF